MDRGLGCWGRCLLCRSKVCINNMQMNMCEIIRSKSSVLDNFLIHERKKGGEGVNASNQRTGTDTEDVAICEVEVSFKGAFSAESPSSVCARI